LKILPNIAFGSAFLNNTPLVAMMIPVIRDLSRSCGLDAKKLFIPLSYASILGGTCTLIGTATNLVISGMITDTMNSGKENLPFMEPVSLFSLSWIGVPVTIAGLAFIMFFGKWLLPGSIQGDKNVLGRKKRRHFRVELKVEPDGFLVGKTLEQAGLASADGFSIICYMRRENKIEFGPGTVLQPDDFIAFSADIDGAKTLWATIGLQPIYATRESKADRHRHHLVEVVASNQNSMLGQRIGDLSTEDREYEVWLVAMARDGAAMNYPMRDAIIQAGDVALLEVKDTFFYRNRNEVEFSMTKKLRGARIQRTDKAILASLITLIMVTVVTLGWMTMLNAALLAAGAMLLTGCMDLSSAGKSVDFSTLLVIASAMGLEAAVTGSGLSAIIGNFLGDLGGNNVYLALAVVFLGCILMDAMVTNVASAVFMFPISLTIAQGLGVSFMPFAITVMVGASCSFISPVSYQTNLMVFGPGGYKYGDYLRIGGPLTLIVWLLTVIVVPLVWPFHP
jgi:di/tricarboxylate transporter